jgi:uncharacterized protein (TIGR03067 family)
MQLVRWGLTLGSATFAWILSQESLTAACSPLPNVALTARTAIQFVTTTAMGGGTVPPSVAALTRGVLASMTFTRVKIMGAVLAAMTLLGGSAGLFAFHGLSARKDGEAFSPTNESQSARAFTEDEKVKPKKDKKEKSDKEKLQGTWVEESRGADDEKVAENDRWKLVFDEDKVTWTDRGKDRQGTFTIDPERKPKEIDLSLADPSLTLNGIYELKDDTFKTLWRENDREGLPKSLDTKKGGGSSLS